MCTPVADSCWCMAKPIQYCKVKKKKKKLEYASESSWQPIKMLFSSAIQNKKIKIKGKLNIVQRYNINSVMCSLVWNLLLTWK